MGRKWTPEQREKFKKTFAAKRTAQKAGKRQKAEEGHTVTGVLTYLRHGAADVMAALQRGEITLRTLQRRDVLTLLAFVETRGKM